MRRFASSLFVCLVLMFAVQAQDQPNEPEPALTAEQAAELLASHRDSHERSAGLSHAEVLALYKQASTHIEAEGFAAMRDDWAKVLADKARDAEADVLADSAILLHDDGYSDLAKPLLEVAWKALRDSAKATRRAVEKLEDDTERYVLVANPKFADVVTRLGWVGYTYPAEMDTCVRYDVDGALAYVRLYAGIDQTLHDVGLYPPETIEALRAAHAVAAAALQTLAEQDTRDAFAFRARAAWLRFKQSQDSPARFDRARGRRAFSPRAMGRESESFDSIWTYSYARPFVLYVEKPIGKDAISPEFTKALESRAALLASVFTYFEAEFIRAFGLRRVKPRHNARQAEEEGWPIEVVVLRDKAAFDQYISDVIEAPDIRLSHYAVLESRVVTYHQLPESDPVEAEANQSRLAREAFSLLLDYYAAEPQFDEATMQTRPRYSSLLIKDGLPGALSGVRSQGEVYSLHAQPEVAAAFKSTYEALGNTQLLRLRDLIECRHGGQVLSRAFERARDSRIKINPQWLQDAALPLYRVAATSAVYFFEQFERDGKHPHREKWRAFLKAELKGEHLVKSWDDDAGIKAFKKAFGIEADTDWDALEAEFLEFTLKLAPAPKD